MSLATHLRTSVAHLAVHAQRPAYRAAWAVVATVAALVAALGALVAPDVAVLPALFFSAALCTWCLVASIAMENAAPIRSTYGPSVAVAALVTACYTSSVVAGGWGVALTSFTVLLAPRLLMLAVRPATEESHTLPQMLAARAWQDADAADAAPQLAPKKPDDVASWSTRRLCDLWWSTTGELRGRPTPRRSLALVELREACLTELWRRDEPGCQRWWRAGPWDVHPRAYLCSRVPGREA